MCDCEKKVKVKFKMQPGCEELLPQKAHETDSGYDLRAKENCEIEPGCVAPIGTGFYVELPEGHEMQIRPRSGLALKAGVTVLNSPGTVDQDYRGEVGVIMYNTGAKGIFKISRGDKIAQAVVAKLAKTEVEVVSELSETVRGSGGFESTGRK